MRFLLLTITLGLSSLALAAPTREMLGSSSKYAKRADFTCERPYDSDTLHRDCDRDCIVNMIEFKQKVSSGLDRHRYEFSMDMKNRTANDHFDVSPVKEHLHDQMTGHGGSKIKCGYIGDHAEKNKTNQGYCEISFVRGPLGKSEAEVSRKAALDSWMDDTDCGTGPPDW